MPVYIKHKDNVVLEKRIEPFEIGDIAAFLHDTRPGEWEDLTDLPGAHNANAGDVYYEGVFYPKPQYASNFDFENKNWNVDLEWAFSIEKPIRKAAIDAKTEEIKARDGVEYDGRRFAIAGDAKLNWIAMATMLGQDLLEFPTQILTMDDSVYPIDSKENFIDFLKTLRAYEFSPTSPVGKGRALRAQIEAAGTMEELDAVIDDRE